MIMLNGIDVLVVVEKGTGRQMEYKWQRRDKKQVSKKRRMKKHNKNLGQIYRNSVRKKVEIEE